MGRSVILSLFALTENLFAFLMCLTLVFCFFLGLLYVCIYSFATLLAQPLFLPVVRCHGTSASRADLGWSERFVC